MTPCKNKELRLPAKSIPCSEACYSPRPKRLTRPARSDLLAPPEATYSPRPKRVARPARSELLAPLGASCSPHSERVAHPARSELLAPLEATYSLHSKGIARCALSIRAAVLEPYQYSCSKTADSPALRVSPALLRTVSLHRTGRTGQYEFTDAIWFTVRFKFSGKENLSKKDFWGAHRAGQYTFTERFGCLSSCRFPHRLAARRKKKQTICIQVRSRLVRYNIQ